jgi:hypothetical protein
LRATLYNPLTNEPLAARAGANVVNDSQIVLAQIAIER